MGILWTIIIGFLAGVIAKFIMPGDNEPSGFILTTVLGIVGAFVATYLGQALGWYRPGEGRPPRRDCRRDHRAVCLRTGSWGASAHDLARHQAENQAPAPGHRLVDCLIALQADGRQPLFWRPCPVVGVSRACVPRLLEGLSEAV